jgi:hypothetical protein
MAKLTLDKMLMMVVSLVFLTFLLPIGLVHIAQIDQIEVTFNNSTTTLADAGLSTPITLLTTLVPLSIAIGIVVYYIKFAS